MPKPCCQMCHTKTAAPVQNSLLKTRIPGFMDTTTFGRVLPRAWPLQPHWRGHNYVHLLVSHMHTYTHKTDTGPAFEGELQICGMGMEHVLRV